MNRIENEAWADMPGKSRPTLWGAAIILFHQSPDPNNLPSDF
jgi:hypothetical protein